MAIGFTPKHSETYSYYPLTHGQFLILAMQALQRLNCRIVHLSEAGIVAYTQNKGFKFNAELRILLGTETAVLKSSSTGSEMIDLGKNKKMVKSLRSQLDELMANRQADHLQSTYESIQENLMPASQDTVMYPGESASDGFISFFALFKPVKGYLVTPIILNINLLVFILMVLNGVHIMSPDSDSLIRWGANFTPLTLGGEWWRLLSSCFLHIGVLHLMMNMYALIFAGVFLDPVLGWKRFAAAYLLTGISGSLCSVLWHDLTVSAGASGAIFGMYGVSLALLSTSIIEKSSRRALLISIGVFVIYNLANGLKGGVDNAAHIGGLLSGFLIGLCFIPSLRRAHAEKQGLEEMPT